MFQPLIRRSCCALLPMFVVLSFPAIGQSERVICAPYAGDIVAKDDAFLAAEEGRRQLAAQVIQVEVSQQLAEGRQVLGDDPNRAISKLKQTLQNVERAADLPAEARNELRRQLVTVIKECQHRKTEHEQQEQYAAARRAAGRERQRMLDEGSRRDEKLKQIVARYNSLLSERRFREAEQAAGDARNITPSDAALTSAVLTSRMSGYIHDNTLVREARQKGVVDALFTAERANVPFADEPPIVYPNSQVWEELTLRREKYAAMSLEKRGSAEEKIFQALQDTTTIEFIETPLRDVMEYVEDLHGIEIEINYRALEDIGISADTPITRNLKGISLRSALKLMLQELDLTYTVRNEVLQITTPEEVAEDLTAKVYPVADLVLPINSGAGANPFQMGGGLGGRGGFGGGMNQPAGGGAGNQLQGGNFGNLFGGNNAAAGPIF